MSQPSYSRPKTNQRRSPQKKGISGLMIALIVAGVVGFFFLIAVGGLIFFISQVGSDSDEMKTVVANNRTNNRTAQLDVPSNWEKISGVDRNVDASIQYGNLLGEKYVMVISETKSELKEVLGEEISLDDFASLIIDGTPDLELQDGGSKKLTVNGLPARRFRMTTDLEGLSIVYLMTLLESESNFHQVHAWTLTSREKKNMPILIKVSDTFKEK